MYVNVNPCVQEYKPGFKHWKEALENPRRPIIKWHVLQVVLNTVQVLLEPVQVVLDTVQVVLDTVQVVLDTVQVVLDTVQVL
jgi:hypothetical protein